MRYLFIITTILVLVFILVAFINMSVVLTEKQPYQVLAKKGKIEFRYYPPVAMATVQYEARSYKELSSPGFRTLANYIFGGNQQETKIAMTSPVHMNMNDTSASMSFVMPSNYDLGNLPKPNNEQVKLYNSNEEYVACIEFGGYVNDEKLEEYKQILSNELNALGIQHDKNFRFLGYNPPYQVIGRKNEIIVGIDKKDVPGARLN